MRFDPRRLGARCNVCPIFRGCKGKIQPVGPRWVDDAPMAVLMAERPGSTETFVGKPLVGQAGQFLDSILETRAELLEHDAPLPALDRIHKTNAVLCEPLKKLSDVEWRKAIAACRPRLRREFDTLLSRGWNARVIALGAKALQALSGELHIKSWMGPQKQGEAFDDDGRKASGESVDVDFTDIQFLPTVNPAMCLHQPQWTGVFITHLLRGWEFSTGVLPPWQWKPTYIQPNVDQLEALMSLDPDEPLAMDVETDGPQHPITHKKKRKDYGPLRLLDIGFSNGRINVCVQWHRVEVMVAAGDELGIAIAERTKRLLLNSTKAIWQNFLYDGIAVPEIKQWRLPFAWFDTLVAFKQIAPLLPGDLATQASLFTHAPRWKDEFKMGDDDPSERYAKADPDERALYCARDCESTYTSFVEVSKQLENLHSGDTLIVEQMELLDVALEMQRAGSNIDRSTFAKHRDALTASTDKLYAMQVEIVERTGGVLDLLSDDPLLSEKLVRATMILVSIFGEDKVHNYVSSLAKWNPDSRFHVMRYFARTGYKPLHFTESDQPSYAAKVLEAMCKFRDRDISDMARALLFYRKDKKILSTNIEGLPFRLVRERVDGLGEVEVARVHPRWLPFRAKSGRWGCQEPNEQNLKKSIRDMFIGDYFGDEEVEL